MRIRYHIDDEPFLHSFVYLLSVPFPTKEVIILQNNKIMYFNQYSIMFDNNLVHSIIKYRERPACTIPTKKSVTV